MSEARELAVPAFPMSLEPDTGRALGEKRADAASTPRRAPPYAFLAVTGALALAVDAATKLWAVAALESPDGPTPLPVIDGHLELALRRNTGGAWSLFHDAPEWVRRPFFVLVSVAAVAFIVVAYRRLDVSRRAAKWGYALVLGGALGNLVDRVRDSAVVDFIHYRIKLGTFEHHWPTFNVADVAIVVGVGLLAVDLLANRRRAARDVGVAPR